MNEFTDQELVIIQDAVFSQSHETREAMRLPLVDVEKLAQRANTLESIGKRVREERRYRLGGRR
jgi:hypothetical protein